MKLQKYRKYAYIAISIAAMFFSAQLFCLAEETDVVVVNDSNWPPYFFAGNPEKPQGFAKELLERCLPETGYEFTFKYYPIQRMFKYIEEGKLDINIFSYTPERESFLVYGKEVLFSTGYKPAVRADSDIQIHSIQDFDGLRLGHLAGLEGAFPEEFQAYLQQREDAGSLITVTHEESLFKMLLADRIDVLVLTEGNILWLAKQEDARESIRILDFEIRPTSDYFVTVSKHSRVIEDPQAFIHTIDLCLQDMKTEGIYAEIAGRYGIR